MDNDLFQYPPLTEEELKEAWEKHSRLIESFIASNKYDLKNIVVDKSAVLSIITKVDQRKKYFNYFHHLNMSEYKEAALNSFWYIRCHPLVICNPELVKNHPQEYDLINEKIALYIILKTLRTMLETKHLSTKQLDSIPSKYICEIIYTFTYRDISKEALIILVESMAVFLGLNPYAL